MANAAPSAGQAREHDTSDEEHFSDASEGKQSTTQSIPTTRVERTDDTQSHGEVPGTDAHAMRTQDAQPDELEIIPDRDAANNEAIPTTHVEEVDPGSRTHGDEPGTLAHDLRKADAKPDGITKAPEVTRQDLEGVPTSPSNRYQPLDTSMQSTRSQTEDMEGREDENDASNPDNEHSEDGQVGADDDFDDFADGDEADDFGTFDEGAEELSQEQPLPVPSVDSHKPTLPLFSFEGLDSVDDIVAASEAYVKELFPGVYDNEPTESEQLPELNPAFLNERSQSLWAQLVAPPPLQPPNWIRSRTRRLFLVSLGVPVDLDEILPASKQKKLVLPSIEIEGGSPQPQREQSGNLGAVPNLEQNNPSAASLASNTSKGGRKKRGPTPPPDVDLNAARLLCSTTDAALGNLTEEELKGHVLKLDEFKHGAGKLLEYWLIRRDSANGDKEAFEEVIENLVKHAKKIRK